MSFTPNHVTNNGIGIRKTSDIAFGQKRERMTNKKKIKIKASHQTNRQGTRALYDLIFRSKSVRTIEYEVTLKLTIQQLITKVNPSVVSLSKEDSLISTKFPYGLKIFLQFQTFIYYAKRKKISKRTKKNCKTFN